MGTKENSKDFVANQNVRVRLSDQGYMLEEYLRKHWSIIHSYTFFNGDTEQPKV